MDIALAIIQHPTEEAVLIAQRRSDTHLPGLWEFPGGKRLPGETLPDCAVRETWEEVGLRVRVIEPWPPLTYAYPERTVTLYPFYCGAEAADARPLGCQQVAWVAPADLRRYPFPPANAPLLERLARRAL